MDICQFNFIVDFGLIVFFLIIVKRFTLALASTFQLWTVCLHPNTVSSETVLKAMSQQFSGAAGEKKVDKG